MIFTNQIEIDENDICYYRKAYSPEIFNTLSIDDKHSLIAFTVKEFSNDVTVNYSNELCDKIGVLMDQDVLLINNTMLINSNDLYSLNLYLFIYTTLVKRFVMRKKNFVFMTEKSYINDKLMKEEYRKKSFDIIVINLLLEELFEMKSLILINNEKQNYFSQQIKKLSNYLIELQENIKNINFENSQKEQIKFGENEISVSKNR